MILLYTLFYFYKSCRIVIITIIQGSFCYKTLTVLTVKTGALILKSCGFYNYSKRIVFSRKCQLNLALS